MEELLLRMKTPKIGIRPDNIGETSNKVESIKPHHLTVVDGAVLVNNRAWIPETLIKRTMRALQTDSHKCCSQMLRKAQSTIYFIGMMDTFDDYVKSCVYCVHKRPMKPALSQIPTERAGQPFEIVTLDFAEFKKSGESFVVIGDKYSGDLHVAGVSKGGTSREVINAIQTFCRSNRIKKIETDGGSQFTSKNHKSILTIKVKVKDVLRNAPLIVEL